MNFSDNVIYCPECGKVEDYPIKIQLCKNGNQGE